MQRQIRPCIESWVRPCSDNRHGIRKKDLKNGFIRKNVTKTVSSEKCIRKNINGHAATASVENNLKISSKRWRWHFHVWFGSNSNRSTTIEYLQSQTSLTHYAAARYHISCWPQRQRSRGALPFSAAFLSLGTLLHPPLIPRKSLFEVAIVQTKIFWLSAATLQRLTEAATV